MRRKIRLLAALLLSTLLAGCIEFERQTVTYSYNASKDTLKIFQDYHGIFGEDDPHELSTNELEQLDSVLSGQRTFFFGNWISEISHDQLRDQLKEIKTPEYQKQHQLDPTATAHLESLIQLLLDNTRAENGAFYLDGQGKLSAVQRVTITGVSKVIAAGNVVIRDAFKAEAVKTQTKAEEKALYLRSAEAQQDYIKLDGNRLTVRLPITRDDYEQSTKGPDGLEKKAEEFKKSGGEYRFANNEVAISIGQPSDKEIRLAMSFSDKPYRTNLLQVIKKRSLLKEGIDPKAMAKEFLASDK